MDKLYIGLFILTGLSGFALSAFTYFRYESRGKKEISLVFFFTGLWGLNSGFRVVVNTKFFTEILLSLGVIIALLTAYHWYRFGVEYTGRSLLKKDIVELLTDNYSITNKQLGYFSLFLIFIGVLTNPYHNLFWTDLHYNQTTQIFEFSKTALYYFISICFGYVWYLTGVFYIASFAKQSRNYLPMLFVSIGVLPTVLSNLIPYVANPPITHPVTLMSLGGFISMLITFFAIQKLFTLKPVAREKVFTDINSPIVIFEDNLTVQDYNNAYKVLQEKSSESLEETLLEEVTFTTNPSQKRVEYSDRVYTATVTPIYVFNQITGYAVSLEEVTELENQKEQLELANRHFKRFSDSAAHELRNPLTIITGYAEYIIQNEEQEELQEMAEKVLKQANQIEALSSDFKKVMDAAQSLEEKKTVDIQSAVEEVINSQSYKNIAKVTITSDTEITAGKYRFPQVFEQLFEFVNKNSLTPKEAEVTISTVNNEIHITVTGLDIDENSVKGLLEHGYTNHHKGEGLSISIIDTIAEVHNWNASIEPAPNGFKLILSKVDVKKSEISQKRIFES